MSPVQVVPKKTGLTVIKNEKEELMPTRVQNSWRVYIDNRRPNQVTKKDHFPLPFIDQMLERLAGKSHYCFLDGFSGYVQITIAHSPAPLALLLIGGCLSAYAMPLVPSNGA